MNSETTASEGPAWLDRFEAFTRFVNRLFAASACVLVMVITALIVAAVFYRYVLHDPISWVLDITIFILAFVFFLAVAPALESGSHIEVDLFDPLIPRSARKFQRLIGKGLTLVFSIVFLFFVVDFYIEIVETDELSFTMVTVPLKWVYWIGPVGVLQLVLTAFVQFVRFWRDPLPTDEPDAVASSH